MAMSRIFIIAVLYTLSHPMSGQEYFTIRGHVADEENGKNLAYASISVKGKPIGTISNSEGNFEFHIPAGLLQDTLVISFVGYRNYRQQISNLTTGMDHTFGLKQNVLILDEVIVNDQRLTAREIVEKAVRNIRHNYADEPFRLECFFREIEQENGRYVQLSEAAIQLYDKNFTTKRRSIREYINVKAVRRSHVFRQIKGFNNIGSAFVDLIENNDVRYQRGMLNTKRNQYQLDSVTFYNDRPAYVISMTNRLDSGQMLIDTKTFAFISIGLERKVRQQKKDPYYFKWEYQDSLTLGRTMFSFHVEFKEYLGKMYPMHMTEREIVHIYDPETLKIHIVKKERLELIVNEIIADGSAGDFPKQKLRRSSLFDIGEYDEEFWRHYNVLQLTPLDEQLVADLEKDISLQEQFKTSTNQK